MTIAFTLILYVLSDKLCTLVTNFSINSYIYILAELAVFARKLNYFIIAELPDVVKLLSCGQ